jgi:DNA-binding NarL/FixJ family response regulator
MSSKLLRILVADSNARVLNAMRDLISEFPDVAVVGTATSAEEAVTLACRDQPDLVLIDTWIHGGGAAAALPRIRACSPGSGLVVVASQCDAELARRMSGLGAFGCFEKQSLGLLLVSTFDKIREGL